MISQVPGISQKLAKTWPHKLANYLPAAAQQKYLSWKLGKTPRDTSLLIKEALEASEQAALFLPENPSQAVISIPLIEYLNRLSGKMQVHVFCRSGQKDLLHGFFPKISIFEIHKDHFYLGEPHFREICGILNNINPDLTILLEREPSLLLLHLQVLSGARLRIGIGVEHPGFLNLTVASSANTNYLNTFHRIADLWERRLLHSFAQLIRIGPDPVYLKESRTALQKAGLSDKQVILFLWDADSAPQKLQAEIINIINRRLREEKPLIGCRLVIGSTGKIQPDIQTAEPGTPCFSDLSMGKLVSLISLSQVVTGLPSSLLFIAGYLHKTIRGLFRSSDQPSDISHAYPNFRAEYFDTPEDIKAEMLAP